MMKTYDCRDCIFHGPTVIGKMTCRLYEGKMDPDCNTGTYPLATICPHYRDMEGNKPNTPGKCPFCGNEGLYQEVGTGYAVIKCRCGVSMSAETVRECLEKWNGRC